MLRYPHGMFLWMHLCYQRQPRCLHSAKSESNPAGAELTACLGQDFVTQKLHRDGISHDSLKKARGETGGAQTTNKATIRRIRKVSGTAGEPLETNPPLPPFPTRPGALCKAGAAERSRPGSTGGGAAARPGTETAPGGTVMSPPAFPTAPRGRDEPGAPVPHPPSPPTPLRGNRKARCGHSRRKLPSPEEPPGPQLLQLHGPGQVVFNLGEETSGLGLQALPVGQ